MAFFISRTGSAAAAVAQRGEVDFRLLDFCRWLPRPENPRCPAGTPANTEKTRPSSARLRLVWRLRRLPARRTDPDHRRPLQRMSRVPLSLQLPPTIVATSLATISGAPSGTRIFFRLVPSLNTNDRESGDQNPGFLKPPVRTGSGVSVFKRRTCTPPPLPDDAMSPYNDHGRAVGRDLGGGMQVADGRETSCRWRDRQRQIRGRGRRRLRPQPPDHSDHGKNRRCGPGNPPIDGSRRPARNFSFARRVEQILRNGNPRLADIAQACLRIPIEAPAQQGLIGAGTSNLSNSIDRRNTSASECTTVSPPNRRWPLSISHRTTP